MKRGGALAVSTLLWVCNWNVMNSGQVYTPKLLSEIYLCASNSNEYLRTYEWSPNILFAVKISTVGYYHASISVCTVDLVFKSISEITCFVE